MTLDEAINHCRKKAIEQKECNKNCSMEHYQLLNWLIELKNFKKEEQKKIRLLENIIIKKDVEIRDLSRKLAKWEVPGIER